MAGVAQPLGLVALAAIAVLVVLLRFARRTPAVRVGSLWLWGQVPSAPHVRRRTRPDALFWLQAAAVAAIAVALAQPWWSVPGTPAGGAPLVAVLDVSASMQTREAAGSRLALARAHLDAELAALPAGTPAMLVAAAARPRVVVRWTTDVAAVRAALARLGATDEPTRLARALALAAAERRRRPGTRIAVATDLPPPDDGDVAWHAVGATDDNAGITRLAVDAPPFAPVREAAVTATVRNFAARPRTVTVRADVDGVAWTTRTVALAPGAAAPVRLEAPPRDGIVSVALDGDDALAVDDRAVTALAPAQPLDLLLVSDSDALAAALSALVGTFPDGRLEIVNPAGLRERDGGPARDGARPVAILDGVVPAHPGALARPALLVAPPPENAVCPGSGVAEHPAVVDWDAGHPILAELDGLAALAVPRATALRRPPWGVEVLRAATSRGAFPLLVAGDVDGWRRACLAAPLPTPLTDADALPLVVVTLSALRWLGEQAGEAPIVARTGEAVRAAGAALGGSAAVRAVGAPPVVVATRAGVHRLRRGDAGERVVLASLLDEAESDVGRASVARPPAAAGGPGGGTRDAVAGSRAAAGVARADTDGARRPLAPWLLAAALFVLAAEWLVWGRP